ncbi:MAG TPA: formimidoylglutamate deiminase [Rhodanobacteraceae bacterium]|jgi:formimidoylglutamate deiminase|nr:formimidoylglutamate deiminase [Rhodanobacteraceae bacterium]
MLQAEHLWTPHGWQHDAALGRGGGTVRARFAFPGMPNLHSHAFQRAMAGLAERRGPGDDSFWTWREAMYAFASRIGPDALQAIAAQLYVEMLKAGYTHVCEFHYLHNAPDGRPYADAAAMSRAIVEAAREAGIGLTLLPVLYMTGGFDGRALSDRQKRFGLSVDAYLGLVESLGALASDRVRVGVALHSLRAVPEAAMREVLAAVSAFPPRPSSAPEGRERVRSERGADASPEPSPRGYAPGASLHFPRGERGSMPVHIHIAEQIGEVQDCLGMRNARPVQWLFDHADVDERWCLVHATHVDDAELRAIAASGAVAGLCPTTEANLGDGFFPLANHLDAHGALGIGSDSHISVSPVEELRWLEYGQRLLTRHRNIAARTSGASVGEALWRAALQGGCRAAGIADDGAGVDFIVPDDASPLLAARDERSVTDAFLFAGNVPLVRDVMAGGEWVVRDFRHRDEARIAARYRETVEALAAG